MLEARGADVQVGPGGDDAEPVRLDLSQARVAAVAGPAGSGRSSTLTSWATQLHERGAGLLALAESSSPLSHGPWPVHDPLTSADGDWPTDVRYLMVDDAERLPDLGIRRLITWASAAPPGCALVVAATTDALTASFTGLGAAVRRHRTGVLLQPERPLDGDAFGVSAERPDVRTPGRGLLIVRGRTTPVQVALPPPTVTSAEQSAQQSAEQWGTAS
jgi:S-DNA-T family DNA segregation ATPase FtsK/SpoIIIE